MTYLLGGILFGLGAVAFMYALFEMSARQATDDEHIEEYGIGAGELRAFGAAEVGGDDVGA